MNRSSYKKLKKFSKIYNLFKNSLENILLLENENKKIEEKYNKEFSNLNNFLKKNIELIIENKAQAQAQAPAQAPAQARIQNEGYNYIQLIREIKIKISEIKIILNEYIRKKVNIKSDLADQYKRVFIILYYFFNETNTTKKASSSWSDFEEKEKDKYRNYLLDYIDSINNKTLTQ